jgi:hypothetical protein
LHSFAIISFFVIAGRDRHEMLLTLLAEEIAKENKPSGCGRSCGRNRLLPPEADMMLGVRYADKLRVEWSGGFTPMD